AVDPRRECHPAGTVVYKGQAEVPKLGNRLFVGPFDGGDFFLNMVAPFAFLPCKIAAMAVAILLLRMQPGQLRPVVEDVADDALTQRKHLTGRGQVDGHILPLGLGRSSESSPGRVVHGFISTHMEAIRLPSTPILPYSPNYRDTNRYTISAG